VSAALVAERRRETRILAVLGETPKRQARGQRVELAVTMFLALLGGAASGVLLAVVAVPSFARAAAPGSGVLPTVQLAVDGTTAAVMLAGLVGLLVAVLVAHGARVRRDAGSRAGVPT
jgi:ABC-type antimicrobial peptide transport system permease subunit